MRKLEIAPSVLSLNYAKFNEQCEILNQSEANWLHFDVMDGHFVPNLTFGPDLLKGFKQTCRQIMDVHLMVEEPTLFAKRFIEAGADIITFHYEVFNETSKMIDFIKELHDLGVKAGISMKPNTRVEKLDELLPYLDLVLIMSVEPGFGGQSFMADMLKKVTHLRQIIDKKKLDCVIEIDGGINAETAKLAVESGVDVLVAGSYVFNGNIIENIASLKCLK